MAGFVLGNFAEVMVSATPLPLDPFIPNPDVRERFHIVVHAPARVVLDTAREFDLHSLWLVHLIFRFREWLTGSTALAPRQPKGLLEETTDLGWGTLVRDDDRLIVCGATCQPWLADVVFSPLAADTFTTFAEPNRVKIAWTLEAYEDGPSRTVLAHETRVVATDAEGRRRFRQYWRWARFGIIGIRWLLLPAIRREAERRWAATAAHAHG